MVDGLQWQGKVCGRYSFGEAGASASGVLGRVRCMGFHRIMIIDKGDRQVDSEVELRAKAYSAFRRSTRSRAESWR